VPPHDLAHHFSFIYIDLFTHYTNGYAASIVWTHLNALVFCCRKLTHIPWNTKYKFHFLYLKNIKPVNYTILSYSSSLPAEYHHLCMPSFTQFTRKVSTYCGDSLTIDHIMCWKTIYLFWWQLYNWSYYVLKNYSHATPLPLSAVVSLLEQTKHLSCIFDCCHLVLMCCVLSTMLHFFFCLNVYLTENVHGNHGICA
jgi:hypothetical protein